MMTDEEEFFAWLDGELDPADTARAEAKVAADPQLQALASKHRALHLRLHGAFESVTSQTVPERLADALNPRGQLIDLAERRAARRFGTASQWGALAATLVVGIVLGATLLDGRGRVPVEIRDGRAYAAADIGHALSTQLASAGEPVEVRVGLTFRNDAGAICRTFDDAVTSGLACRDSEGWRVRGLFPAPEGQGGEYRMAGGVDPSLTALIDSTIAGEPFDARQEAKAMKSGWR